MTAPIEYLFDISNHNDPVIDWARVVAPDDVPGGWLKLTQATDFIDGLADDYVAQAKDDGVMLGGYHFGDHRYDALTQARFFFDRAQALGLLDAGDLAPMYDVENWGTKTFQVVWPDRATIRHHVNVWLDEAVRRSVKRALVYGSLSWWLGGMLVPSDYERDDIEVLNWIAVYNGRPGDLQGWSHPRDALHQYTSDGTFDGIDGRVDKNSTLNGRTSAGLTLGGHAPGGGGGNNEGDEEMILNSAVLPASVAPKMVQLQLPVVAMSEELPPGEKTWAQVAISVPHEDAQIWALWAITTPGVSAGRGEAILLAGPGSAPSSETGEPPVDKTKAALGYDLYVPYRLPKGAFAVTVYYSSAQDLSVLITGGANRKMPALGDAQ